MLKALNTVIYRGFYILRAVAALCLLTIVVIITAGIITRYLFDKPFTWTEELSTLLFIWLAFLGAAVVSAKRNHVAVDFITEKFPPSMRKAIYIVTSVLIMILLAIMFIGSIILMPTMTHKTVALQIPRYYNYIPIMIASFYMLLVYIEDLIHFIRPELFKNGLRIPA
ncbi:MAG: TRAP transporter small permease [Oscillospiraceae bacterium]